MARADLIGATEADRGVCRLSTLARSATHRSPDGERPPPVPADGESGPGPSRYRTWGTCRTETCPAANHGGDRRRTARRKPSWITHGPAKTRGPFHPNMTAVGRRGPVAEPVSEPSRLPVGASPRGRPAKRHGRFRNRAGRSWPTTAARVRSEGRPDREPPGPVIVHLGHSVRNACPPTNPSPGGAGPSTCRSERRDVPKVTAVRRVSRCRHAHGATRRPVIGDPTPTTARRSPTWGLPGLEALPGGGIGWECIRAPR